MKIYIPLQAFTATTRTVSAEVQFCVATIFALIILGKCVHPGRIKVACKSIPSGPGEQRLQAEDV